jgi:hypothetical protein
MTPESRQGLRDRAAEWERRAAEAQTRELRETLLTATSRWRALADEDERRDAEQ